MKPRGNSTRRQSPFRKQSGNGEDAFPLLLPVAGLLLVFWFANFLYRKKIFLRL